MRRVRDDPRSPDADFAELYGRLPPPDDLEPWLGWCRAAAPPVLYLGIGAGRLAAPLHQAGVALVGVDAHPGMLERLRRRLPGIDAHLGLVEELELGRRFDLVIAPSSLLDTPVKAAAAARQLAPRGRLALELMNPHWLRSGASPGVRAFFETGGLRLEVDYAVGGETWVQDVQDAKLIEPEAVEEFLEGAGLRLVVMRGAPGLGLEESSTFYVLAELA